MRNSHFHAVVAGGLAVPLLFVCLFLCYSTALKADPGRVEFSKPAASVEAYDLVEIAANIDRPDAHNPFLDATLTATFQSKDGSKTWKIEGFCDSTDGSVFRIRFMPSQAGDYSYNVTYRQGSFQKSST
jgi:hypothetical protein